MSAPRPTQIGIIEIDDADAQHQLGLHDYLLDIQKVVKDHGKNGWVKAEISAFNIRKWNAYLDLVEHNAKGEVIAKATGIIQGQDLKSIRDKFKNGTGGDLKADTKVLVHVRPQFDPQRGLSLLITDIDPAYTLGDMEMKLAMIRADLEAKGIYELNKRLPRPLDFTRLAVIAPQESAGLGDFNREAAILQKHQLCTFVVKQAVFQGKEAAKSIYEAMLTIWNENKQTPFDALVIIRGGGAKADLQWLNHPRLAEAVCKLPIPVMVGVGHEKDKTILDEIAMSFDTPSKVIKSILDAIINNALKAKRDFEFIQGAATNTAERYDRQIETYGDTILGRGKSVIEHYKTSLIRHEEDIKRSIDLLAQMDRNVRIHDQGITESAIRTIAAKGREIDAMTSEIAVMSRHNVMQANANVNALTDTIKTASRSTTVNAYREIIHQQDIIKHEAIRHLQAADREVNTLGEVIDAQDPKRVLERGYSLTRDFHGKVIRRMEQAKKTQTLYITLADGTITATNEDFET